MTDREFHAWLDQVPRTPGAVFVRTPHGETRLASIPAAYAEWRRRAPQRSWRTSLERRTHQLAILTHLLEKEERDDRP